MLDSEVKRWIKENPLDADNCEDLSCWAAEEFNLSDEQLDEAYVYARKNLNK